MGHSFPSGCERLLFIMYKQNTKVTLWSRILYICSFF
uniref:Uncharacterized protein n=1 Tax=Lepeophtheirus salmonis TaxID=72036 RepID=A0A0K2V9T8_LEPSM